MQTNCAHECANACTSLETALRHEQESVEQYRALISECDFPSVRTFFEKLVLRQEELCREISEKLSELRAERTITNQISTIF